MSTTYFPPMSTPAIAPFRVLKQMLANNPALLDEPNCPYPDDIKLFLKELMMPGMDHRPAEIIAAVSVDFDDPDALIQEFEKLYREIQAVTKESAKLDPNERIQWAKAATGLLEKIVTLKEKSFNIRSHSQFQRKVIDLIDVVLAPEQRTEFVRRLGDYLELHEKARKQPVEG